MLKVDKFVISKLLSPVIKDNTEHYEVQWKGYRETTIEPRDILLKDVPKMVNQYEKKNNITLYDSKNKRTKKITKKNSYGKNEEDV